MKKAKKCLALFLVIGIVLALFCACDEDSEPKTKEELLTAHPWGSVSDYDSDYISVMKFLPDGSYIQVIENYDYNLDPEGEPKYEVWYNGTWSIKGDTLSIGSKGSKSTYDCKFRELDEDEIDDFEYVLQNGEWYVSDNYYAYGTLLLYEPMSDSDFDKVIADSKEAKVEE